MDHAQPAAKAQTDRPWLRDGFRHPDLREWTLAHRNQLIQAALTLIQNWLAIGRPRSLVHLPGFERWSEVMGGILAASGVDGFLDDAARSGRDAGKDAVADLIAGWKELPLGRRGCTVAQALDVLREDAEENKYVRLSSALVKLCLSPPGQLPTARQIGYALRRLRGHAAGGLKLQARIVAGSNLWFVQPLA